MEKNNSSRKNIKKVERDEIIGRALSRAIKEDVKPDECPTPEELSAFIDGTLDEQQRDRVIGHLSQCDRCYEVISVAHEMMKEEKEEAAKGMVKRKSWFYAPIAVAAAAVLVILIKFVIPIPGEYAPLSSTQIVDRLAKNTDVKFLSNSIKEDQTIAYGFTEKIPLEKASFRIGVCLTDLEVSLRAEDKAKSEDLIKRIISLLQSIEGSKDLISYYGGLSKKMEQSTSTKQFSGEIQKVETFLKDKDTIFYLRFGEWVEGGRIAAVIKNREFFDIRSNQYFIKKVEGKGLPQGVLKALREIKGILVKNKFADRDYKHLERAFKDLMEMI
jgi:hypothetical protein